MKSFLKYCLVLLLGVCYFSATLEVCEAEKKLNYEKETHTYIHADKETEAYSVKTVKQLDDLYLVVNFCHRYLVASDKGDKASFALYNSPPPKPDRLYLFYSVFLI